MLNTQLEYELNINILNAYMNGDIDVGNGT